MGVTTWTSEINVKAVKIKRTLWVKKNNHAHLMLQKTG